MKLKRYSDFISEVKTQGTYLDKGHGNFSEEPIHKQRFGNVFAKAKKTSGIDWGIKIKKLSQSNFKIEFEDSFFKHLEEAAKTGWKGKKKKWIEDIKADLSEVANISINPENFNRTHFSGGIPNKLRGISLGYIIYEALIKHLGFASSQSDASDRAKSVWAKIAEDPDFLGVICGNKILVIYKEFKDDVDEPGDIILAFINQNIDDLIDDDLIDYLQQELSKKQDLSTNQLIDYIQQNLIGLSIDKEVLEKYTKVREFLITYFQTSRSEIKDLTNKTNEIKNELSQKYKNSPKAALEYYQKNKLQYDNWFEILKTKSRFYKKTKIEDLDFFYYNLVINKIESITSSIKTKSGNSSSLNIRSIIHNVEFNSEYFERIFTEEKYNKIKDLYLEVKDKELEILNNLPQLSEKSIGKKDLLKEVKEASPSQFYKEFKFEYLKTKIIRDFETLNPEVIENRVSEIERELDDISDLAVRSSYKVTKLIEKYYPDWKEYFNIFPTSPKKFLENQLKLSQINSDIRTFDEVYQKLSKVFETHGFKKAEELYKSELKPQIENIPWELTLDLSWCQNTLTKYFKDLTKVIKKKPIEAFDILLKVMNRIEIDKKKAIEKKAYKQFTKQLELAFKEGGYQMAEELYNSEIEKKSELLDLKFFDEPDYETSNQKQNHIELTGREHIQKRMQLYKKLGQFPKIVVKPKVKEPEVEIGQERPEGVSSSGERTFIQRFRDFLGI